MPRMRDDYEYQMEKKAWFEDTSHPATRAHDYFPGTVRLRTGPACVCGERRKHPVHHAKR